MKKALTIGLVVPLIAFAQMAPSVRMEMPKNPDDVKNTEGYVSFGLGPFPVLFPVFGIGGRFQDGHHGFDFAGQVASVIHFTTVKENASYFYYFNPNLASQFYVGGGVAFSQFMHKDYATAFLIAPEFTFGKEYRNEAGDRRFFQLQVDFPEIQMNKHGKTAAHPAAVLSYGICF